MNWNLKQTTARKCVLFKPRIALESAWSGFSVVVHFQVVLRVCCVRFVGAGVAHTHGEAEDEEGGGPAGSGAGLGPRRGGLRNTHT